MPDVDYEAEYNNRARVPEHPQIFARWGQEAAAYRAERSERQRAELAVPYGNSPRQIIDLFPAEGNADAPLAMFIHGGYWRSLEPAQFSHMARGLNGHGVSVAVAGYDLCPQVTIAQIIDQMQQACLFLWRRHRQPIMVYGHSAGGHLAACLIATDWKKLDRAAPIDLVPAAYSISGVFDLTPLLKVSMNEDLRLDGETARRVSPQFWPAPKGLRFDAVVGALESGEFLRQSRDCAAEWGKGGAVTRYEAIAGTNHFTVIDPLTDPASGMVRRLAELMPAHRSAELA
jgi:arylformamidase